MGGRARSISSSLHAVDKHDDTIDTEGTSTLRCAWVDAHFRDRPLGLVPQLLVLPNRIHTRR